MLVQFNFSNFKSFKDEVSLDMTATSIKEHPYNVFENSRRERFIKVAVIYGANASGKTGIIDAFWLMRQIVMFSFGRDGDHKGIPVKRFVFDKLSRIGKSQFEVFFSHNNREYQYGFKVDNKKVYEEWLYRRDLRSKNKYRTLFERDGEKIHCEKGLEDAKKFIDLVEESTLFLSLISHAKIKEAKIVLDWFRNCEVMDFGNAIYEGIYSSLLPVRELQDEIYLNRFQDFLKAIDVGIHGIRVEKLKDTINEKGEGSYRVYSKHKLIDGSGFIELPFQEESSGTKKMFALYSYLVDCLKHGTTLFIDELDAKLHPLLLRYIITMFHNPEINRRNAQLIYTTHEVSTLTKETFRRDQIWFTEKDERGVSSLYSLAEYKLESKKVRNDASYNKDYLSGRYGAIPVLKEFSIVWE